MREKVCDGFRGVLREIDLEGLYDCNCQVDRDLLAGIFIPVIERYLDEFKENHNNMRYISVNKNLKLYKCVVNLYYKLLSMFFCVRQLSHTNLRYALASLILFYFAFWLIILFNLSQQLPIIVETYTVLIN